MSYPLRELPDLDFEEALRSRPAHDEATTVATEISIIIPACIVLPHILPSTTSWRSWPGPSATLREPAGLRRSYGVRFSARA